MHVLLCSVMISGAAELRGALEELQLSNNFGGYINEGGYNRDGTVQIK